MRETAEPDVEQDAPPAAPAPATEHPNDQPHTTPDPAPAETDEPDEPRPARITPGPALAMTAETVAAAGAGLWHVAGWTGVALGTAGLVGAGAAAARRRPWSGEWRRTRSWSTTSSRRVPGSSRTRRSSGGTRRSSFGGRSQGTGSGSRRGGAAGRGGTRARSRTGGLPQRRGRSGFPGVGKPGSARRTARRAAADRVLRSTSAGARRVRRAGASRMDRAAAAAVRGRAAARAARHAARQGASPRAASRAARAALKDAHRTTHTRGAWRRMAGSMAWGAAGWAYAQLHAWSQSLGDALRELFALRRGQAPDEPQRERIKTTVDRPDTAAGGHAGGADMGKKTGRGAPQFVHVAEELAEAFRRYEPPPGPGGMVQMYSDVGMLPDVMDQIAQGINVLSDRCRTELPLHPAVGELVGELAKVQAHMASVAAEIRPAIERLHEADLERHRAPRPAERLWDVG